MLPINEVSGATLDSVLIYLAIIGILLLIATVLRLTIPVFKKFYMPASLLAGIMGLILGPHFINLIPAEVNSMFSALAGRLIVLVYAPMLMRKTYTNKRELARVATTRVVFNYFGCFSPWLSKAGPAATALPAAWLLYLKNLDGWMGSLCPSRPQPSAW